MQGIDFRVHGWQDDIIIDPVSISLRRVTDPVNTLDLRAFEEAFLRKGKKNPRVFFAPVLDFDPPFCFV